MELYLAARTILLSLLLVLGSTIGSHALTFSLAGNWNSSADAATNEWSYGTFTVAGNASTFVVPSDATNSGATENFWTFPPPTKASDPNIEKNLTSSAIFTSGAEFRPGTVSFGPFNGPAVAQFIAPTTGIYNISGQFQIDQIRSSETSDGTTGYVYVGGVDKFAQELLDPGAAQFGTAAPFSLSNVTLTAGEKVDFVLGGGAFTSEVDATLTELPEPSTYAMMAFTGLILFCGLCRKSGFFQV